MDDHALVLRLQSNSEIEYQTRGPRARFGESHEELEYLDPVPEPKQKEKKKRKNPEFNQGFYRNKKLKEMRQKELNASKELQPQVPVAANTTNAEEAELDKVSTEDEAGELDPAEGGMGITVMEGEKLPSSKERKLANFLARKEARKSRHAHMASGGGLDQNYQEARHY